MRNLLSLAFVWVLLFSPVGSGFLWVQSSSYSTAPSIMSSVVIMVEFQDRVFPTSFQPSSITRILDQMVAYFAEVSANRSAFSWSLHSRIVRLDRPLSFYGSDRDSPGDDKGGNPKGLLALMTDTLAKVDPEIDFTRFRYVIIAHAGQDQARTAQDQLSPEIWSQTLFKIQPPIISKPEGAAIDGASIVSHTDPLGVWVHELAHQVGQLPDMYVRSLSGSTHLAGPWSLMDQGAQLGDGKVPSHLDAWSKWVLGWLEFNTLVLSKSFTAVLEAVDGNPRPTALRIPLTNGSFYVVEARVKRGFDSLLPNEGVLIYIVKPGSITSETIVQVIDMRPDTRTLEDAVLGVQKVYEDKMNRVFIQLLSREGDRFTLKIGTQLTVKFSLQVPNRVFTLMPVPVNLTVQPLISGLSYELIVDGVLYEQALMSQPHIIHELYFTPWRVGNHNITFVVNDARNSVIHREVQQIAVEIHPLIPLAFFLLVTVMPILYLIRRRPRLETSSTPSGHEHKGLSDS